MKIIAIEANECYEFHNIHWLQSQRNDNLKHQKILSKIC